MDGTSVRQSSSALMGLSMGDFRTRVGSFSGTTPSLVSQDEPRFSTISSAIESTGYPSIQPSPVVPSSSSSTAPPVSMANREKKSSSAKRLMKRNSRPTSPVPATPPPPCISTTAAPIPTANANKILVLMKTLCGRMRGKIDYRTESGGGWYSGVCWIDEESGCLMFDPSHSQGFLLTLCMDLRGSQVMPKEDAMSGRMCIDIVTGSSLTDILIRPALAEEFDLWLAALLCWQDVRQPSSKHTGSNSTSNTSINSSSNSSAAASGSTSPGSSRSESRRQLSSSQGPALTKSNTIKVAKVGIWDKGYPANPRAAFRNPSPYDRKQSKDSKEASWAKVSCLLQDNGELRFQSEHSFLNVIDVTQLARSAIQHLDRSVFEDVEFCLAIFPIYAPSSTHLCFSRPIYVSFESRMLMDVWYVLLRSFAQPHLFRHDPQNLGPPVIVSNFEDKELGDVFRIERTLKVRVTEAKLKARDRVLDIGYSRNDEGVTGNYFAEIILDGEVRTRTIVKTNTKNPFWREDCSFADIPPTQPLLMIILKRIDGLEAERRLHFSKPVPPTEVWCGSVDIPIEQLEKSDDHEQWLQILDQKHLSIGTMLVKVQHEEMAVLLASEYEPLRELLQRSPAPLATKIARLMPNGLRKLSETLLNVFQVSGNVNEWLMALVEEEIDGVGTQEAARNYRFDIRLRSSESMDFAGDRRTIVRGMNKALAGEANLLFRGNSLLTQALECHMRRLGKEYLEEVLKDKIVEINDMNPNCEIDPSKLEPNEDINRHWTLLLKLTTEVWTCIASSASQLPSEIRQILKFVRAVAEDRYGDFSRTVSYTSVTGFLFLRFICPAILSPKLFGLLRDIPGARVQRTFTFIAKALQAMANMSTFGQKESWMEPMNRFINQQRQSFKDFVDEACAIVDYQQPHISASYSTPHAIMSRMCATSREGVPMLPYLVDPARNMATLVKMWTSAHAHDSEDLPSGDIFLFNSMCHALQKRADACMKSAELLSAAAEVPPVATTATVDVDEPTELNPVTMEHESPLPTKMSTSMSASSLPSLASPPFHEFTRDRDPDAHAPGSAGSDVVETTAVLSGPRKQTMSAITPSAMGIPSSSSSSSSSAPPAPSVASRRTSAAAALSGSLADITRHDLHALSQLHLQTQPTPAPPASQTQSPLSAGGDPGISSPVVQGTVTSMAWAGAGPAPAPARAARNNRTTRNIISAVMRIGRSGETAVQGQPQPQTQPQTPMTAHGQGFAHAMGHEGGERLRNGRS
ncbi:hypothetical protein TD95_003479 [Thielaviopsis punctulata]|uniref:Uncharacterized protein n=1 Tax=Thielaviopsis punctulata TaxID=72032 RepID=A0A0F4ZGY6_9PEZI|nr:hypothetical protein TD95_003479 [Thielaviopsis punctulata]